VKLISVKNQSHEKLLLPASQPTNVGTEEGKETEIITKEFNKGENEMDPI
jgi:hypothetical protein